MEMISCYLRHCLQGNIFSPSSHDIHLYSINSSGNKTSSYGSDVPSESYPSPSPIPKHRTYITPQVRSFLKSRSLKFQVSTIHKIYKTPFRSSRSHLVSGAKSYVCSVIPTKLALWFEAPLAILYHMFMCVLLLDLWFII